MGLRQGDLIDWYLNQQEELDSLEALAAERTLVKRIIARLVNVDNLLFVVPQAGDEQPSGDERFLTVRPDYEAS